MRPADRGAVRSAVGADRETAEDRTSTAILAERADDRKQLPDLGSCANCGAHIRLVGGATTCPTCAAWRRWYSSFRLASKFLREATK